MVIFFLAVPVDFLKFFKEKIRSRFWFQLFSFDEWVSPPLRELPGMVDCGTDKGSLLTGPQSEQNN